MAGASHSGKALARSIFLMIIAVMAFALFVRAAIDSKPKQLEDTPASSFTYSFHVDGTLDEAASIERSGSEYWWVDSGARLIINDNIGKTIQGRLSANDTWRRSYAQSSAEDTDSGYYPQNLFRLVTRREWDNVRVEADFRIRADNKTDSSNRNESNGLFIMSRYKDGDNLYYAGLRVDGHAVIKKKTKGTYTTLAEKSVFSGDYDGTNLLPHDEWITLRSEIRTNKNAVEIILYQKTNDEWREILRATDISNPILGAGHIGIRTDFMDVEFDNFRAEKI